MNICSHSVSRLKILPEFEEYCRQGYYPYFKEDGDGFNDRLKETVLQTIEQDMSAVEYSTCMKLKKLLMMLASQVEFGFLY